MQCITSSCYSFLFPQRLQSVSAAEMSTQRNSGSDKELLIIIASSGHVVSTIQLANTILRRDRRLVISLLVISPMTQDPNFSGKLSKCDPDINLVTLPKPQHEPAFRPALSAANLISLLMQYIELHKDAVRAAVKHQQLLASSETDIDKSEKEEDRILKSTSFILDWFCASSMMDVAAELGSNAYVYYTNSAAFLGLLTLFLPTCSRLTESDSEWLVPSYARPIPATSVPPFFYDARAAALMSDLGRGIRKGRGVVVNTAAELEPYALSSIAKDGNFPAVYPVGPLLNLSGGGKISDKKNRDRIMEWLDAQEAAESVVFLCFGNLGSFGAEQVKEIALGLEESGVKFLWALRKPPPEGKMSPPGEFTDPQEILPEGFLSRIGARGLVCGWAPQAEILAHRAIGGFVSHCGWNSILEALSFGVPIAAWPMYAEQQANAFYLVEDLKLAVGLKINYSLGQTDLVTAREIQNAVELLMNGVDNEIAKMRVRVGEIKKIIRAAVGEDGRSSQAVGRLINDMCRK
uniref:Glycosyltransferase n=1 Tax=Kalanchoe fedtschenkoi TaxID=63787 RepID=A0A7N0RGQ3_KALFE